jgi:hypothetical protein
MHETFRSLGRRLLALAVTTVLGVWLVWSPAPADEPKPKSPPSIKERVGAKDGSSDPEFIRRAYLDVTGVLPTPEEVAKFVADKDPGKRQKLIDQLLSKKWGPLEDMLAQAMKNNPDILVAESKVREAEAKLTRTRLQVMQNIVALRHSIDAQKTAVKEAEVRYGRMKQLQGSAAVSAQVVEEAEQTLVREKAKLTALEAGLPYLLGQGPGRSLAFTPDGKLVDSIWIDMGNPRDTMLRHWQNYFHPLVLDDNQGPARKLEGTISEKIRKARDKQVTLDYKNKPAQEVLEDLLRKIEGVPFRVVVKVRDQPIDLQFKEPLSLAAALQAWQDLAGGNDVRFVVRDYGILVTYNTLLPEGATQLNDFWKEPPRLRIKFPYSPVSPDAEPKK